MSDLANLSDDELMEKWTEASEAACEATATAKEYAQEFNQRETAKAAKAKFDALTDTEKAEMLALAQTFEAEGIASQEAVGEEAPVSDVVVDDTPNAEYADKGTVN